MAVYFKKSSFCGSTAPESRSTDTNLSTLAVQTRQAVTRRWQNTKQFLHRLCKDVGPKVSSRTQILLQTSYPNASKKVGVFEGQNAIRSQCARSLGRFSVPASYQAQATPVHRTWSYPIQDCHIRHISISSLSCPSNHVLIPIPS